MTVLQTLGMYIFNKRYNFIVELLMRSTYSVVCQNPKTIIQGLIELYASMHKYVGNV